MAKKHGYEFSNYYLKKYFYIYNYYDKYTKYLEYLHNNYRIESLNVYYNEYDIHNTSLNYLIIIKIYIEKCNGDVKVQYNYESYGNTYNINLISDKYVEVKIIGEYYPQVELYDNPIDILGIIKKFIVEYNIMEIS